MGAYDYVMTEFYAQLCSSQRHNTAGEKSKTAWKIVNLCGEGECTYEIWHFIILP